MITSTDPISDMLSRIRNGMLAGKSQVSVPYSQVKESVAKVLSSNGFLDSVATSKDGKIKSLIIIINTADQNPAITHIKRVSKPGRRVYVQADKIPVVKRGRGMVVVSTSSGILSGSDAKSKNLGGELICEVF